MKIAIFSDIHGNLPALQAILDDIKKEKCDKVVFLGDAIGIGPCPKECLELLLNSDVIFTPGNHELYYSVGTRIDDSIEEEESSHHKWIEGLLGEKYKSDINNLPLQQIININGKTFVFQHFLLARKRGLFPFEEMPTVKINGPEKYLTLQSADYTFIGHEHKPFSVNNGNQYIIDVGSSGCSKDNKTHYTILNIDDDVSTTKKELTYDRVRLVNDILSISYPDREFLAKIFFGVDVNK